MCNLVTCGGNLKLLTQTQQKEDRKNRAVNLEAVHSWGTPSLEKGRDFGRTDFLHSWGRDLVSTGYSVETARVAAAVAADSWLQFLSLWCAQKTGPQTHHLLQGFREVWWTRQAVLRLQPQPRGGAVGAIAGFPPVMTVSSHARLCGSAEGVRGIHSSNN